VGIKAMVLPFTEREKFCGESKIGEEPGNIFLKGHHLTVITSASPEGFPSCSSFSDISLFSFNNYSSFKIVCVYV
jgi:hypothetical protein